jgi:hypothetical protein
MPLSASAQILPALPRRPSLPLPVMLRLVLLSLLALSVGASFDSLDRLQAGFDAAAWPSADDMQNTFAQHTSGDRRRHSLNSPRQAAWVSLDRRQTTPTRTSGRRHRQRHRPDIISTTREHGCGGSSVQRWRSGAALPWSALPRRCPGDAASSLPSRAGAAFALHRPLAVQRSTRRRPRPSCITAAVRTRWRDHSAMTLRTVESGGSSPFVHSCVFCVQILVV